MTSVLLDRVSLERGPFRLEADCSFGPGLHVVTGRIGSGKSTLALALAGGLRPASGAIRLEGVRRRVLVLQSPDHHLTGATVEAEASSWGVESGPLLDQVGLTARAGDDPFRLSRGEQKRLVLGCALQTDADLLVLDEPFASLDVPARLRLGQALADARGRDDRDDPRRTVSAGGRDPMADTGRTRRPGGVMDDPAPPPLGRRALGRRVRLDPGHGPGRALVAPLLEPDPPPSEDRPLPRRHGPACRSRDRDLRGRRAVVPRPLRGRPPHRGLRVHGAA